MSRIKIAIPPQVNICGGDLLKKWFVYYSVRNPRTCKMERFKDYKGLHGIKNFDERLAAANDKAKEYLDKLQNGWTPFEDISMGIYEDQLEYRHIVDIYNTTKKKNRQIHYFASMFMENVVKKNSHGTASTYRSKLRTFNAWLNAKGFSEVDVTGIENKTVVEFFNFLIDDRKLSKVSVQKYRQILFNLFEFVVEEKALKINPVYKLPTTDRINDHAPRPIQQYDIEPFKKYIQEHDPQLWMAIEFEFYCYIRPGHELRLLKVGDIDFARGIIHIDRANFKGRRENVKEIPEHFLLKLRNEYKLHTYARDHYVIGKEYKPGPEHLGKNNLRFRFVKYRKVLNMPSEYKFYSWKHTGGVMASDANIPEKDISDQMGHTDLRTTSTYLKKKGGGRIDSIRKNYPKL